MTRYWIMRTAAYSTDRPSEIRRCRTFIYDEIRNGRLRQGWGWKDSHDLNNLLRKSNFGQRLGMLTREEREDVWKRVRWMHPKVNSPPYGQGIQKGDIVVLPNLPIQGSLSFAKVSTARYRFRIHREQDTYRHIRDARLIGNPINSGHMLVTRSNLRRELRAHQSLRNIDACASEIEGLVKASEFGVSPPRTREIEKYGLGGEGEEHRKLKEWVAKNPEKIGLGRGTPHPEDYDCFITKDRPDIWFELADGRIAVVEVETFDPEPGAHQAIKYKSLMCAKHDKPLDSEDVIPVLVAWPPIPQGILDFCARYKIKAIEKKV